MKCNLKVLLAERNLKITQVSNDTGISRTTLTSLSNGEAKGIQFSTLETLCNYLNITANELFIQNKIDTMKNIKLLLLGGLDVINETQFFIKVIDHEPTLKDKKIFLEETINKYVNKKNNLFPIKDLKLENIKILDCEDKVVPIDVIKSNYFNKIIL